MFGVDVSGDVYSGSLIDHGTWTTKRNSKASHSHLTVPSSHHRHVCFNIIAINIFNFYAFKCNQIGLV